MTCVPIHGLDCHLPKSVSNPAMHLNSVDEQFSKTMTSFPLRECFFSIRAHFLSFFVLICNMRANLEKKMLKQEMH